jgi:hypothetical protein
MLAGQTEIAPMYKAAFPMAVLKQQLLLQWWLHEPVEDEQARTHLVLNGEVDEVGIYQYLIGWAQLRVVLEEQC